MLWVDRAQSRLGPRQHGETGKECRRRLPFDQLDNVDQQELENEKGHRAIYKPHAGAAAHFRMQLHLPPNRQHRARKEESKVAVVQRRECGLLLTIGCFDGS